MTKPYRIKHKASGLYYQPASNHSNLSKNGKVYMTNEEFCKAHIGERVLFKGKDIGAYVAGYLDKKYIILGFDNFDGCISTFTPRVCTYVKIYNSYRFAKLKYLKIIKS